MDCTRFKLDLLSICSWLNNCFLLANKKNDTEDNLHMYVVPNRLESCTNVPAAVFDCFVYLILAQNVREIMFLDYIAY